jgi:hypothetical protein
MAKCWRLGTVAPPALGAIGASRTDRLEPSGCGLRHGGGKKGGDKTGPNPTDKGKPGSKHHLLVDRKGIPLTLLLTAANVHDSKVLEDLLDGIPAIPGPRGRPRFTGLPLESVGIEIGQRVPQELLEELASLLRAAARKVTEQFRTLGNEERTTGALFSDLNVRREVSGWVLNITNHNYSGEIKEPIIGADAGIIVDITDAMGLRATKAGWFQAKRVVEVPKRIAAIHDLESQMDKMLKRTRDGYALLYTPRGVRVFQGDSYAEIKFDTLVLEMVRCSKGDRDPEVLIDTFDSRFLLEVLLAEGV